MEFLQFISKRSIEGACEVYMRELAQSRVKIGMELSRQNTDKTTLIESSF